MRGFASTFFAAVGSLLIASSIMAQSETTRVIYYPPWNISKLPMYLARDMGIFERNGLKIEWINPGSNEKLLAALKKGDADIVVASANHIIYNNASGGSAMRLVGNTGYNYSAFLAEASVKSASDLRGKKIGTGEPGSTPDQLTRLALKKLGIDPEKDITLVHFDEGRNAERVKSLLAGDVAGMMVTAEAMYELEKNGEIKRLNKLTDHKQLKIFAGGGADYGISVVFLQGRREDARRFMSAICEGISIARTNKEKALQFVAKSGRKLDPAAVEYLYQLYITEVIPPRPHLRMEGIELAAQMAASLLPRAGSSKAQALTDADLVPELEKQGRCNFSSG
jgi:NitT/TauT family transport system substrate-binding protein